MSKSWDKDCVMQIRNSNYTKKRIKADTEYGTRTICLSTVNLLSVENKFRITLLNNIEHKFKFESFNRGNLVFESENLTTLVCIYIAWSFDLNHSLIKNSLNDF